jgi:hypothetical protein
MYRKTAFYDPYETVSFTTEAEGLERLEQDRIRADTKKKEQNEKDARKTVVLLHRSEKWSDANPYGVFFIKDMSHYVRSGYVKEENSRYLSCQGYFPSEDIAQKAVAVLEESSRSYDDKILYRKDDGSSFKHYFRVVNGFTDEHWWNTTRW